MSALIIDHVAINELPEAWRAKLSNSRVVRVTVHIEEENLDTEIPKDQLFGMWRDRKDMANVDAYIRNLRTPRV